MTPKATKRPPLAMRGYSPAQVDALLDRLDRAGQGGTTVPADEVREARFDVVARGYDRRAVDELLAAYCAEPGGSGVPGERPGDAGAAALAEWVRGARFRASRFRPGFDAQEVDAFLDRVVAGLCGDAAPVAAAEVRSVRFTVVRFMPGYDGREVHRFLVKLADVLERD
ncbi:DivIVA domain-containing protein [Actinomadura atramentaria]|uniref:DivIVA domain-containing protein n=1 Tax=Actinomadura atramentaria TaxID=1990 RepID=UPI000379EF0C|nr:DivIVA domain-containing protein [Actinomadura atramentaria]